MGESYIDIDKTLAMHGYEAIKKTELAQLRAEVERLRAKNERMGNVLNIFSDQSNWRITSEGPYDDRAVVWDVGGDPWDLAYSALGSDNAEALQDAVE